MIWLHIIIQWELHINPYIDKQGHWRLPSGQIPPKSGLPLQHYSLLFLIGIFFFFVSTFHFKADSDRFAPKLELWQALH